MRVNSVREGYVPLAMVVALILATPVSWAARLRALAWGVLLVQAFVMLRTGCAVLHGFTTVRVQNQPLLDAGAAWTWFARRSSQILGGDLHLTYIAPLLVWVVVLASFTDIRQLVDRHHKPNTAHVEELG